MKYTPQESSKNRIKTRSNIDHVLKPDITPSGEKKRQKKETCMLEMGVVYLLVIIYVRAKVLGNSYD